jgi:26S proteasome non-ATPase regulatory subunit 10
MTLEEILEDIRESAFFGHDRIDVHTRMSRDEGDQPLHTAAIQGNYVFVEALLAAGADPNAVGEMGKTPLHYAASFGYKDIVELLLAHGASPHIVSEFGNTPAQPSYDSGR